VPWNQCDTEQLIEGARRGDESASQELLMRHRSRLRRMVAVHLDARLAARVDPSDIVQDALGEASRKLDDYLQLRPVAFYPWLRQIAWERLIDIHRRHVHARCRSVAREHKFAEVPDTSVAEFADHFLVKNQTTPSQQAVREETRRRVREALQLLTPQDRELLLMRYLEQLHVAEIADVLCVGQRAIKSRLRRALERLHGMLGHDFDKQS
jgi:RNA polymerase sigma-70 factor (ECF subfamily)